MAREDSAERGAIEARLEWWRRASFVLLGVIILGVGSWFGILSGQVQDNRDSIAGIYNELAGLREVVAANTRAQQDTTLQLAKLTGQLEAIERLGGGEVK